MIGVNMNLPACPFCGSAEGYGFDNDKLVVDVRTKVGAVFEDGCVDIYSMVYPDFSSAVRVVDYEGDSVECLHCGEEITDKTFIHYLVGLANISVQEEV